MEYTETAVVSLDSATVQERPVSRITVTAEIELPTEDQVEELSDSISDQQRTALEQAIERDHLIVKPKR